MQPSKSHILEIAKNYAISRGKVLDENSFQNKLNQLKDYANDSEVWEDQGWNYPNMNDRGAREYSMFVTYVQSQSNPYLVNAPPVVSTPKKVVNVEDVLKDQLKRQNEENQRQLEQQQAINEQNAIRESELLRQNEEQNIRVSTISKEAIKGTQDFASSQGQKLSLFASDAIGTTAQATNQAIETTAESANQSFNFANENLAQNLVFLAIIGGSGFLIYKNKNKLPKIFR
jgi:hypothetical protein